MNRVLNTGVELIKDNQLVTSYKFYFTTNLFRVTSRACHTHQVNLNNARLCCCLGYILVIYMFYVIGLYQITLSLYVCVCVYYVTVNRQSYGC